MSNTIVNGKQLIKINDDTFVFDAPTSAIGPAHVDRFLRNRSLDWSTFLKLLLMALVSVGLRELEKALSSAIDSAVLKRLTEELNKFIKDIIDAAFMTKSLEDANRALKVVTRALGDYRNTGNISYLETLVLNGTVSDAVYQFAGLKAAGYGGYLLAASADLKILNELWTKKSTVVTATQFLDHATEHTNHVAALERDMLAIAGDVRVGAWIDRIFYFIPVFSGSTHLMPTKDSPSVHPATLTADESNAPERRDLDSELRGTEYQYRPSNIDQSGTSNTEGVIAIDCRAWVEASGKVLGMTNHVRAYWHKTTFSPQWKAPFAEFYEIVQQTRDSAHAIKKRQLDEVRPRIDASGSVKNQWNVMIGEISRGDVDG